MGEPTCGNAQVSINEYIVYEKVTRRTETSKYPEEEKETSISWVAASERERGQTIDLSMGLRITHNAWARLAEDDWKVTT